MKVLFAGLETDKILDWEKFQTLADYDIILSNDVGQCLHQCEDGQIDLLVIGSNLSLIESAEVTKLFRTNGKGNYNPILYMANNYEEIIHSKSSDLYYNDSLITPVPGEVLSDKINALVYSAELHQIVDEREKDIRFFEQHIREEREISRRIFSNLAAFGCLNAHNIKYFLSQSSVYNGEMVLATKKPSSEIVIMVTDFTGSGIPAAMGSYPVAEIFYSMIAKGFSLNHILNEMNKKLFSVLPTGIFCRAVIAEYSANDKTITYWNSGFPDSLIKKQSGEVETLNSIPNIPLGIVDKNRFVPSLQTFEIGDGDKIYLYTDEIFRITNRNGAVYTIENLQDDLFGLPSNENGINYIHQKIDNFVASDFYSKPTLIELTTDFSLESEIKDAKKCDPAKGLKDWHVFVELRAHTLKQYDPMPILMNLILEIPELSVHKSSIYTIIAELYTNALDHGLLNLDSSIKQAPTGFQDYLSLKDERLRNLIDGKISFDFSHYPTVEGGSLIICVEDSGSGFDHKNISQTTTLNQEDYYGRGLALMKSLCDSITYNAKGNRVEVAYSWQYEEKE